MKVGIINMEDKKIKKVSDLFMEENDLKALEKLYKSTNDKLVKILINWRKEYETEIINGCTNESYMYEDLIEYIFKKYNL